MAQYVIESTERPYDRIRMSFTEDGKFDIVPKIKGDVYKSRFNAEQDLNKALASDPEKFAKFKVQIR
jgi:hypothetical protein